jgi:hypothetical protein
LPAVSRESRPRFSVVLIQLFAASIIGILTARSTSVVACGFPNLATAQVQVFQDS